MNIRLLSLALLLPAASLYPQEPPGGMGGGRIGGHPWTRGGGGALQAGVKAYRDLCYTPGGSASQTLDLFVPAEGAGPWPLIIWVHGGGWQNGSKEQCLALRMGFVARGYAVASLNYRLSGEAIFPARSKTARRPSAGSGHIRGNTLSIPRASGSGAAPRAATSSPCLEPAGTRKISIVVGTSTDRVACRRSAISMGRAIWPSWLPHPAIRCMVMPTRPNQN